MKTTKHASERLQQRGIPAEVLDILDAFGFESIQRNGIVKQRLPRREVSAIKKKLRKAYQFIDRLDDSYCIKTEDDLVITVAHQYQ
ncbi:hypothetical protein NX722_21170 [Endozoicomonas gorgoniicola]|uniref:DUF4258 domain-containing protein n=1 Tax=Endozoicomonas gorgoniicola TaxID=1234144 RepID=A0ABT3N0D2_9GAMM|nr:hypothetical protein [Endozoicomonas gorgoniicola]MCW7555087.1 hypothetical protein [Endozoicomonas gorgoniicola]